MIYKEFKGKKLSALGMGCMRLPTYGEDKTIDEAKTAEMFDYAIKNGINYFDTAWGYHNGNSELVVGKLLEKYPRESFYLARNSPDTQRRPGAEQRRYSKNSLKNVVSIISTFILFITSAKAISTHILTKNTAT